MIIQICDICNKEVKHLNTMVLYKQPIEYCEKCREKVQEVVEEFKKELDFEREVMNVSLKNKEKKYIKSLKEEQKT